MTPLEKDMLQLGNAIAEMAALVSNQLKKCREAYLKMDKDLAMEIKNNESRVNAMELSIDRDCEHIFALFNPLASDLRYVISALKINSDLERIGDYANGIADFILAFDETLHQELTDEVQLGKMFDISIAMLENIQTAYANRNNRLARKVYLKDAALNKLNKEAAGVIGRFVQKQPELIRQSLFLFSTIRKLERVGDHVKNIAENIIFSSEAIVFKHSAKKK